MKTREVVIFSGERFVVPQCIQRIDHLSTHGWQLRYGGTNESAHRTQALARALTEVDASHDRVLLARGRTGEWLNRADSLDGLMENRSVDLKAEKSRLEDLDLVQGISDFQMQQTALEAALKSYAQVQRLSLFNSIG